MELKGQKEHGMAKRIARDFLREIRKGNANWLDTVCRQAHVRNSPAIVVSAAEAYARAVNAGELAESEIA